MTAPIPHLAPTPARIDRGFLQDVIAGLRAPQKHLSAKYFYDRRGSDLFEAITRLPEYYPTRTELAILDQYGPEIAAGLPPGAALVEFGSGSTAKVRRLLPHLSDLAAYVPVDVSEEFLRSEAEELGRDFPRLRIEPVAADFTKPFALPDDLKDAPKAGFFPGSTLGNFEPELAAALLGSFARTLGAGTGAGTGATLIVGIDLVKDKAVLDAAYDDSAGVTAAFNLNLLTRINRELGADFDLDGFAHQAFFDENLGRIEMHLVSRRSQLVTVAGVPFHFASGETIHTENSYKYTVPGFRALARGAGWEHKSVWTDPDGLFSVHALTASTIRRH
ncbi:L-histidine N(alpha)-methyltransferase [Methylobacterium frigidaeris]|uniref:Histidine N-alpha-methyltransferase n=1 Tax=Methylobacterium frigidaeris TaxID=2038277 RepID=A0AA37HEY5_9HYPH|nr:L-histidine N(alpha)-methyltransferase [Methylobacterium frigidaeris]PIK70015.1 L-histidine N(alpha)-methyltransferase [Methylobacterium frigidaeris]GJD64514.1 Histidine N-alpha-methyltransferase [Methylobacterium frigidaeris]